MKSADDRKTITRALRTKGPLAMTTTLVGVEVRKALRPALWVNLTLDLLELAIFIALGSYLFRATLTIGYAWMVGIPFDSIDWSHLFTYPFTSDPVSDYIKTLNEEPLQSDSLTDGFTP